MPSRIVTQCLKWKNVEKCGAVRGYSGNVLLKVNTKLVKEMMNMSHQLLHPYWSVTGASIHACLPLPSWLSQSSCRPTLSLHSLFSTPLTACTSSVDNCLIVTFHLHTYSLSIGLQSSIPSHISLPSLFSSPLFHAFVSMFLHSLYSTLYFTIPDCPYLRCLHCNSHHVHVVSTSGWIQSYPCIKRQDCS